MPQEPSIVIAALPDSNWEIDSLLARTSVFVQPLVLSEAHFVSWSTMRGSVQGISPL